MSWEAVSECAIKVVLKIRALTVAVVGVYAPIELKDSFEQSLRDARQVTQSSW